MLVSVGSEPANDAQLASEIDEFIDLLIMQGERSMGRPPSFGYGLTSLPSSPPVSFAAQETSVAESKLLVLDDEQEYQQQQKRRQGQGQQQGVYVCSRMDCGKRFERSNALQRHIASIHDCKGVLCPFCISKEKKFNRSDNFMRYAPTCPPQPGCLGVHVSWLGRWGLN